jgi:signal transduction histidine kinase
MRMQLQGEDTEENRALLSELFRIEQYVEMVLSYIRLGSGQNDFVIGEYELDEIIRQAVHKFAPQFVHDRIRLVYEPISVRVITDEKWLLFIIEQLISNAIKYSPNGTVTIMVSSEKVLSVADTGIGIAPEDLPRIFEKGFTGYNGRADKKATGLGLYLCRQAADKLGIALWAQSKPGEGSTFYLDLHRERLIVE